MFVVMLQHFEATLQEHSQELSSSHFTTDQLWYGAAHDTTEIRREFDYTFE